MLELTDVNLNSLLIRELRPVVAKHPRFRELGGEIGSTFATKMQFNDLEVIVKNHTTDGIRFAPDHYLATKIGRALVAKIEDKDGLFIEDIQEIDKNLDKPVSGMYYFNMDSVDEATREVVLTCEKLKWVTGQVTNATGSYITVSKTYDINTIGIRNLASTDYYRVGNKIYVNKYAETLDVYDMNSSISLVAPQDFWFEHKDEVVIVADTVAGYQMYPIPDMSFISFDVVDQDGYVLRRDTDYKISGTDLIFSSWTPAHQKFSMVGLFRRDPNVVGFINSENLIDITTNPGEYIETNQFTAVTTTGNLSFSDLTKNSQDAYYLTNLLHPGDNMVWEARINLGQSQIKAKKNALNINLIDGLTVYIGDRTVVNDQVAIVVYPYITELYEIYGSKENISFDIDIRTNDMRTSSEIAGLIKEFILVSGRDFLNSCGLTIYEVSRSVNSDAKDSSGILSYQTVTLSISAAADWEIKKPLVTRLDSIDISAVQFDYGYPAKKVSINSVGTVYGATGFLATYY